MRLCLAAAASFAALLFAGPGTAQADCSLKAVDVPVVMEGLRPMVTAKINGAPVKLMVDSGAFFSSLDAKSAANLKMKPVTVAVLGSRFPVAAQSLTKGMGGETAAGIVLASSFEFAGANFGNVAFLTHDLGGPYGFLGQNLLHQVDNEYDLKNGKLRLIQAEGCETSVMAYWATPGMTYSVAPLEFTDHKNAHTVAIVTVNGQRMRAYFDTGAATSFITARAAARAGVKTTDPGVEPSGDTYGVDRAVVKTWVGRFASLKIGDEEIKNGLLRIGATDVDYFDVLIGADFFMAHHVYVANSQRKIYFTYSGGTVFNVARDETAEGKEPAAAK